MRREFAAWNARSRVYEEGQREKKKKKNARPVVYYNEEIKTSHGESCNTTNVCTLRAHFGHQKSIEREVMVVVIKDRGSSGKKG